MLFARAQKHKTIFGKKLTKEMKELCSDKCKTVMKRNWSKYTKQQKDTSCSQIEGINIVKVSIIHKTVYRFNAVPIKHQ